MESLGSQKFPNNGKSIVVGFDSVHGQEEGATPGFQHLTLDCRNKEGRKCPDRKGQTAAAAAFCSHST